MTATTIVRTADTDADFGDETTSVGSQLGALVARNLRTTARVPQLLMFSLTMPMAMLVLFSQVFRSVADGPNFPAGVSYIDFITPAMLAVATVMAGTNVGVAAAIDHTNGLHDRFRTLAMPRSLPGIARTINEIVFTVARAVLLVTAAAVLLGFRFHGEPARRDRRTRRVGRARRRDECLVRQDRRSPSSTRRRPVRRDDGDDAADVRVQRLRSARHHARLDANDRKRQPRRPRHRRVARCGARNGDRCRHPDCTRCGDRNVDRRRHRTLETVVIRSTVRLVNY